MTETLSKAEMQDILAQEIRRTKRELYRWTTLLRVNRLAGAAEDYIKQLEAEAAHHQKVVDALNEELAGLQG